MKINDRTWWKLQDWCFWRLTGLRMEIDPLSSARVRDWFPRDMGGKASAERQRGGWDCRLAT
jgi:hypothetical protein